MDVHTQSKIDIKNIISNVSNSPFGLKLKRIGNIHNCFSEKTPYSNNIDYMKNKLEGIIIEYTKNYILSIDDLAAFSEWDHGYLDKPDNVKQTKPNQIYTILHKIGSSWGYESYIIYNIRDLLYLMDRSRKESLNILANKIRSEITSFFIKNLLKRM